MDPNTDLVAELDAIGERLLDRSLDLLRSATSTDDPDERDRLMADEKRLTRARRAVEKAAALLRGGDQGDTVEP